MSQPAVTILVVDDYIDNLRILNELLTKAGYVVRKATGGQMALKTIQFEPPDLVLLDINMPQMNGYTVCSHLKADPLTQDIPIIFLSALSETHNKIIAFDVGAADYITKPFQAPEVLARVRLQLKLQQQQRLLQQQNQRLQEEIQKNQQFEALLQRTNLRLQQLVWVDGLTGVANRRCLDNHLARFWQQMLEQQAPLSLVLCDVDSFKLFNDHYGHQAGDLCLQQVAQTLKVVLKRPDDLAARYGGEEFALVLPNTDVSGAIRVVELIQAAIAQLQIAHARSPIGPWVTLSMGIACTIPSALETAQALLQQADAALYQAKLEGRDRWCTMPLPPKDSQCPQTAPISA